MFEKKRSISKVAQNILQKRYYSQGEKSWEDIVNRVIEWVIPDAPEERKETTRQMMLNTYFVPNSPCLVNSGKKTGGLSACFVVDFPDTIEGIYKTKLDFALIARKGGGCGRQHFRKVTRLILKRSLENCLLHSKVKDKRFNSLTNLNEDQVF